MRARRILTGLFFIMVGLCASAQTQIQLGNVSGAPEDTVSLPVTLTTGGNTVCSLSLEIRYDESKLTPSAAELGASGTAGGKQITQSTPLPGVLRLGLYGMNQTALSNGVVANVKFTIQAGAAGSALLTSTCGASDCNGNAVTATCGTATVTVASSSGNVHPADMDEDWKMEISEVTSYGSAWKSGSTWPRPPNPIPINYVTNAGALWKTGENYHYDAGADPPWASGTSRLAERTLHTGSGSALRKVLFSEDELRIAVRVVPDTGVSAYAVEEVLPPECLPSAVEGDGEYDASSRTIRWGPYMDDQSRTFGYTLVVSKSVPAGSIHGTASFDGVGSRIREAPGLRQ